MMHSFGRVIRPVLEMIDRWARRGLGKKSAREKIEI
jgi:hypothetical protein